VVIKASNEALIIKSMVAIESFWKTTKLHFEQNEQLVKNEQIYFLAPNEEISEKVDEYIIQLTSLSNSKYVEYVRENVSKQKQIYLYFRELLDLWLETQKEWFRLHPILMSASSIKYHSGAYTQFASLDSTMRKFNKQMNDMINIKKVSEDYMLQSFLNIVKACHLELEKLRKTLEEYMAQKRNNYNRFYFLTDGELITLLQEIRDFQSMEPYLKLCFDLDGFIVEKDIVVGVRSSHESFKVRSLFFKGEADEWFKAVD
jgi:dynein heavy chain